MKKTKYLTYLNKYTEAYFRKVDLIENVWKCSDKLSTYLAISGLNGLNKNFLSNYIFSNRLGLEHRFCENAVFN